MKVVFAADSFREPLSVRIQGDQEETLGRLRGPFDAARAVAIFVNRRLEDLVASPLNLRRAIATEAMRPYLA